MAIQVLGYEGIYTAKVTSITTTSQSITIPEQYKYIGASIVVTNDTDKTIFVKKSTIANGVPTATETGEGITPIKAGQAAVLNKTPEVNYVAVVALAAATGTVYITVGN